ncbi:hypothetical protein SUDANB99_06016 (plasmid) [Streptomyces sp. enrichment culture]
MNCWSAVSVSHQAPKGVWPVRRTEAEHDLVLGALARVTGAWRGGAFAVRSGWLGLWGGEAAGEVGGELSGCLAVCGVEPFQEPEVLDRLAGFGGGEQGEAGFVRVRVGR